MATNARDLASVSPIPDIPTVTACDNNKLSIRRESPVGHEVRPIIMTYGNSSWPLRQSGASSLNIMNDTHSSVVQSGDGRTRDNSKEGYGRTPHPDPSSSADDRGHMDPVGKGRTARSHSRVAGRKTVFGLPSRASARCLGNLKKPLGRRHGLAGRHARTTRQGRRPAPAPPTRAPSRAAGTRRMIVAALSPVTAAPSRRPTSRAWADTRGLRPRHALGLDCRQSLRTIWS